MPKIGIPGQFSGLIPKILEKKSELFPQFFLSNQEKSCTLGMLILKMFGNPENSVLINRKPKKISV
jgi:hypothetical protein